MFKGEPTETPSFLKKISIQDLPDIYNNLYDKKEDVIKVVTEKLHPFDFLFDDEGDVAEKRPFNYYIWHGSHTFPPCAENVLWITPEDTRLLSTSFISMFMEALIDYKADEPNPTTSGNNRFFRIFNFKFLEFCKN